MTFRTGKINENYYALNNNPNYYQFKKNYHFIDSENRQYMIALDNDASFRNLKFQPTVTNSIRSCLVNNDRQVILHVRLPKTTEWFTYDQINQSILLRDVASNQEIYVTLMEATKPNHKRRTGTITIAGLDVDYCNLLLNQ